MRVQWVWVPAVIAAGVLFLAACAGPQGAVVGPAAPLVALSSRVVVDGSRCPSSDAEAQDVVAGSSAPVSLLPLSLTPERVLVCEFSSTLGDSAQRGALKREISLTGKAARELVEAAKAVELRQLSGSVSCPADFATVTVLAVEPERGRTVDLWWSTSGCQSLDNGTVRTTFLNNPSFWRFQSAFKRLTAEGQVRAAP